MGVNKDVSADGNVAKELSAEEAKMKREEFLALTEQCKQFDEVDPADSGLATFILPGD